MNISVKTEYALRAILDLAMGPVAVPIRIADIARRQKIPQKFLETILAELKKSGFVESRRGAEGGYLLARPASMITVGAVLRSMEGGRTGRASMEERGPLEEFWGKVDTAIAAVIDRADFDALAREWREREARFAPNWEI